MDNRKRLSGAGRYSFSNFKKSAGGGPKDGGPKTPAGLPRDAKSATGRSAAPGPSKPPFDRPTTPATPAFTASPAAQATDNIAQLAAARTRWERLAGTTTLSTVVDQITSIPGKLDGLDNDIAALRTRGYRFGRNLEEQTKALRSRWPQQQFEANRILQSQRMLLQNAANEVQQLLAQAERNYSLLGTVNDRLGALESHINEAQRNVRNVIDDTEQEITRLQTQVRRTRSMLDALERASFSLLPDEHGVAMCEAKWISDNQQPEGMLFLTTNRLIFEHQEERVIKRKLFSSEKERIQQKLWDTPIGAIVALEMEDKKSGLLGLGRQELLTLRFAERTRELPSDTTLHLKGGATNEEWLALIRRVQSGQIAADMVGAPPPQAHIAAAVQAEAVAEPANLPTRCPNCNAALPPIYKGMKQVECAYCGMLVNL